MPKKGKKAAHRPVIVPDPPVPDPPPDWVKNRLLRALAPEEMERLLPSLEPFTYPSDHIVFRAADPAAYVYFPQGALISLLATMEDGRSAEVGLTGEEGIVGVTGALGAKAHHYTAATVVMGSCLRMPMAKFKAEFARGGGLEFRVLNYVRYLLAQVSQTAACNRLHWVKQRLARRLLMIQDSARKDEFER